MSAANFSCTELLLFRRVAMSASESLKNSIPCLGIVYSDLLGLASTRSVAHVMDRLCHDLLEIGGKALEPGLVEQNDEEALSVVDLREVLAHSNLFWTLHTIRVWSDR